MTKQKPATWTVGAKVEGGWTVVRVRQFFAVLKNDEKPAAWAFQTIDGKITKAKSSAEAGEKGRAYRDAQKAKGITVERAPRKPAAKKAPAKSAAKAPAKKASAKDRANGRGTSKPAAKKSVPAAPARTRKPRATR
jgi:hypothetical protein